MTRTICLLAVLLLSGCADDAASPSIDTMSMDSEHCRANTFSAMIGTPAAAEAGNLKLAVFDKAYRACMTDKGYDLPAAP